MNDYTKDHIIDDLLTDRAKFIRTSNESVKMLSLALAALRKNKSHVTDQYVELVIRDLENAVKTVIDRVESRRAERRANNQ